MALRQVPSLLRVAAHGWYDQRAEAFLAIEELKRQQLIECGRGRSDTAVGWTCSRLLEMKSRRRSRKRGNGSLECISTAIWHHNLLQMTKVQREAACVLPTIDDHGTLSLSATGCASSGALLSANMSRSKAEQILDKLQVNNKSIQIDKVRFISGGGSGTMQGQRRSRWRRCVHRQPGARKSHHTGAAELGWLSSNISSSRESKGQAPTRPSVEQPR